MYKTSTLSKILLLVLLALALSACGSRTRFQAPEIPPPEDLIPGYLPKGFELVSGFELDLPEAEVRLTKTGDGKRVWYAPPEGLIDEFLSRFNLLRSPLGNEVQGVNYQSGDQLLLITKSYFPGGSLEKWRGKYERPAPEKCECDCDCGCPELLLLDVNLDRLERFADVVEERVIEGTRVAILEGAGGWVTVFVRGDYLLTVAGDLSLEENLKIVESLLGAPQK